MAQICVSPDSPDKPDWALIQSLYLKGLSPKQIEEQTGVKADNVSTRAYRGKWRHALVKSSVIVTGHNNEGVKDKAQSPSLSKHSDAVRAGLADVLMRSVEKIQSLSMPSPKAALKANAELESVVRNAKAVFGWSEGASQPSVRINVMGTVSVHGGSESGSIPTPAIEQANAQPLLPEQVPVQDQS